MVYGRPFGSSSECKAGSEFLQPFVQEPHAIQARLLREVAPLLT